MKSKNTSNSSKPSPKTTQTLGSYAHDTIATIFKKTVKQEKAVLNDTAPEPLHQMRVGMRRLRTAQQVFADAIVLPKAAQEKQIQKIARILGALRDLDVLEEKLTQYRSTLKGKEGKALDAVIQHLQNQRADRYKRVKKVFSSDRYQNLKTAFPDWLQDPEYSPTAALPIDKVLPDLLLPIVSQLMLHPGWLVCTAPIEDEILPIALTLPDLQQPLKEQGSRLHSLRKQIKRVRYQTEFFVDLCSKSYRSQLQNFKTVQDILGRLQDCAVLQDTLAAELAPGWAETLPTVAHAIQQDEFAAWQEWQPLQKQFLNQAFRDRLRNATLMPSTEYKH